MNPVVLIATHNRLEITKKNITSLMMQSVQPKIVLVVSDQGEWQYYQRRYPEITLCVAPNNPLGQKWQHGVDVAKKLNPNPLIICGSDDILGVDFIENACVIIKSGYHFVGLKRWWVYAKDVLYQYDYNSSVPLGGGRCYSYKMLTEMDWRVFDTQSKFHLDDYGWLKVRESRLMSYVVTDTRQENLHIVSVKGDWPMLNPFDKFKNHRNVTLLYTSRDKEELNKLINYG